MLNQIRDTLASEEAEYFSIAFFVHVIVLLLLSFIVDASIPSKSRIIIHSSPIEEEHAGIFTTLQNQKLPELDKAMSALVEDLNDRGLLQDTAIIWMGEFGRTPNINGNTGRDHWARSWSVVVGGAGFKKGIIVGETSEDGKEVITEPYSSQDLMASVLKSLNISLETTFTSKNGRPMKIANSGKVIKELF